MEKEFIEKILNKEGISYSEIEKSNSGFTNEVFFVDNKYVIKVLNKNVKPEKIQKEIDFYKNVKLDFIPRYITSGQLNQQKYLIIQKLEGKSLFNIWHELSKEERKKIVIQIAKILEEFHKQKGDFLNQKFIQSDWLVQMNKTFQINIEELKSRGYDATSLIKFKQTILPRLFKQQKNGLVYNDAHFDNFIYDGEKVQLIDFDRVIYASIDYELLILKTMLDEPAKFANEEDEKHVLKTDYEGIYDILQEHYPALFDFEQIDARVFVYQFIYRLGQGFEYNSDENIKHQLEKFAEYFNL